MSHSKKLGIAATSLVLTAVLAGSCSVMGQTTPRPPQKPSRPAAWNPQSQQTFVAYWTVEPGWNTTLEIRNNLKQRDLTVTPVLRTSDGQEITLAPVTLHSEQVTGVDLRQALSQAGSQLLDKPGSFGSAVCRFYSNDSTNIFASTIVQHPGTPISFHFDENDIDEKLDAENIESIWWIPAATSTDQLVLANASTKPLTTVVTSTDASGRSYSATVNLPPRQTNRVDLRSLARQAGATNAMGGLSVNITKGAGSLMLSHFVYDETTGLAALMKTFEHDPSETPAQHSMLAPMVALSNPDPTLGFPADVTLIPQVLLRNTTAGTVNALLTLNWRSASTSGHVPVLSSPLKPGEVRIVNLVDVENQDKIPGDAYWGTLTLNYQGHYGDIVPIASSFDASGKYGLQTPFSEGLNRLLKGSMWHVDSMRTSIITTGNGGTTPTHAALTLFYNDGKDSYAIEQLLQPGEQIWADIGNLIRSRVPDKNGKVFPTDVMMGSYEIRDIDHYNAGLLFEGKLVIDRKWGHGYYGCALCCGYGDTTQFDPNPYTDIIGNGTWDSISAYDGCSSSYADVTDFAYSWASDNMSVATVASAYTSLVGGGGANASSYVTLQSNNVKNRCPSHTSHPAAPVTTQIPTDSRIVSNITNASNLLCAPGYAGWYRRVHKRITDQNGNDILTDGQSLSELPTISLNGLGLPSPQGTSTTTSGGGYFDDIYSFCSSACPGSGGETDVTQQIFDILPNSSTQYDLNYVNLVYKCGGITSNGQ